MAPARDILPSGSETREETMGNPNEYHRWSLGALDLQGLTPEKARDIIVKCFIEAQKETFHQARERLGASTDPESIQKSMATSVRMVFAEMGYDYDRPTPEALGKVVERLARSAMSWGTPPDIIEHHKGQIEKVLGRLGQGG
jgi:hypothetical protein